jgi:hypothetical protein
MRLHFVDKRIKPIPDALAMPHKVGVLHAYSGKGSGKSTDTLLGIF